MKKNLLLCIVSICIITPGLAQTPQWNWVKGAGSNVTESVQGNHTTINLDSAGNVYERISSNSGSISFGSFAFTNPRPATPNSGGQPLLYYVKYSPQGTVLWAKQYRNLPDGYVLPGPNSMFVRPDGTSYLHIPMTLDSIVVGGKVARNPAINFYNPGACIAQYDAAGNVVRLNTSAKPYGGWEEIMPLPSNQMLALTNVAATDTLNGIQVSKGTVLAILDSNGNVLKAKTLGYDSNSIFNLQPLVSGRYMALNSNSIYLLITNKITTHYNKAVIPFDSIYTGPLLVKLDTGLNFKWAKPINSHFGTLIATDELDNVYLPFTAASRDTVSLDTIVVPFPFKYVDHFDAYLGLAKLNSAGKAQWIDTILIATVAGGMVNSVCADRMGNSYLMGRFNDPTYIGTDTLHNGANMFVAKYGPDGDYKWVQTTQNGSRLGFTYNCMADDGHGNIYINGIYADPNYHLFFGKDSLVAKQPINNYPLASDVFLAKLGNCNPVTPLVTASAPLKWCGNDSVILTAPAAKNHLWSTGETSGSITVHQSGKYSVYTADTLGCYAGSAITTVKATPLPELSVEIVNVLCKGDSSGELHLTTNTPSGSPVYSKLPSGVYIAVASDTVGCTVKDTVTITEPAEYLTLGLQSIKQGNATLLIATGHGGTPAYTFRTNGEPTIDSIYCSTPGWYRVSVTDLNGCTKSDSIYIDLVTASADVAAVGKVMLYPNPALNHVTIEVSEFVDAVIELRDTKGRLVLSERLDKSKTIIGTAGLSAGVYIVHLKTGTGVYTQKLILQK